MRKLAHIEKIKKIRPISNADRIEVAEILGWECVVKKGEFKEGETIIYVEVDSLLPSDNPAFAFMRERKYRVKTIKLRKQISQGLVFPLDLLPKGSYRIGQDVSKILNITQFNAEQDIPENINSNWWGKFVSILFKRNKKLSTKFPSFISKTDEERIQNCEEILTDNRYKNEYFEVTEKIDGTSSTYYLSGKEFGICSRNLKLPTTKTKNSKKYWEIAYRYSIKKVLKQIQKRYKAKTVVLQGEIIGTNIQNNKYKINNYGLNSDLFVFNLIIDGKRLDISITKQILSSFNIKTVPLVDKITLPETITELVEMAKNPSVVYGCPKQREGIVVRNNKYDVSFKVINPEFLLYNDE